jgi:hypothetical protein
MDQLLNKYYICDFSPDTHTVHVYFTNMPTYKTIEIKLPVVDGMYPEGVDLDNYIMSFCPVNLELVEEKHEVAKNLEYISAKVKNVTKEHSVVTKTKSAALQKRANLLYNSDWTQLADANGSLDDEEKRRWKSYRQELRDITKQPGWPMQIVWPKQPFTFQVTIYE